MSFRVKVMYNAMNYMHNKGNNYGCLQYKRVV